MDNYSLNSFTFDYKNIIIDEIALNGLEGIGFYFLWNRVEKRVSAPITSKMKNRFWKFIVNCEAVTLYEVPEPLPRLEALDRFDIIDEESGYILDTPDYLDGPYEYCLIENEYGSCSNYTQRQLISKDVSKELTYNEVDEKYGDRLAMVASLEERWRSLAPHAPISLLAQLTPLHYCLLELIGKSRENGQTSTGKTNLTKMYKEPKLLFYSKKCLSSLDLIQVIRLPVLQNHRLVRSLLLRLKRFHKPSTVSIPNKGRIRDIIDHLAKQPNHCERVNELLTNGLLTPALVKKLRKCDGQFVFDVTPLESLQEQDKKVRATERRCISLNVLSDDESGQSDDEPEVTPVPSQYNVKIPIMRQAYECFINAGLNGLTQYELAQALSVEFYTARLICRLFKNKNLVRVFLEDKGKQRSKRYISVTATSEMDVKFEEERRKFMQYASEIEKNVESPKPVETNTIITEESEEVPAKKIKLEEGKKAGSNMLKDCENYLQHVVELDQLRGLDEKEDLSPLFSTNKLPTLRQLRFVNGIFKVLTDKKIVTGLSVLSNMVAREIGEPPMDTKRLKYVVQRLISDKKVKVFKMMRPGRKDVFDILICAASVKSTDPLLKAKYKELTTRAINNTKFFKPKTSGRSEPNLAQYSYPKYMKIRKLHEFIVKFVYFDECKNRDSDLPDGFASLVQLIPEFTVEFALGNLSSSAMTLIPTKRITEDMLKIKLREAPEEIANAFILSSSLQFSMRNGLKILAMFGLIQLIKESSPVYDESIVLSYIFYVNRNATILDTKGKWPRENVDKDAITKSYHFASFDDVKKYWKDVCDISTKTVIELPKRRLKKIISPVRTMEEVSANDNGQRFGDGLGACGQDSMFYLDLARFWSTFYFKHKKSSSHSVQKKPPQKSIKAKKEVKPPKVKKPVCRRKKKAIPKIKISAMPLLKKKRTKPDPSITWTPEEDRILLYCKIAVSIMSPTTTTTPPGSLRLKNMVAKDILSLNDPKKDGQLCHKRSLLIETNSKLMHEKESILAELQHRKNLLKNYEGLFKTLRVQTVGSVAKFVLAGRKPMLELVYLISKIVKSPSYGRRNTYKVLDYDDFHKHYSLTMNPLASGVSSYNRVPEQCDINITTIKEAVVLALMASYKKEVSQETAEKIHRMLNAFSETQLRLAVEQLRRCGAVAAKEKVFNNHLNRFNYKAPIVQQSYRISALYDRKLINRLNSEFCEELFNYIYETPPTNGVKGSPGFNCLICELLAAGNVYIFSVTTPAVTTTMGDIIDDQNITEMETKFTLKAGICGWRSKGYDIRLNELYKELEPQKELDLRNASILSTTSNNKSVDGQIDKKIVNHLMEKKEAGSTFSDLQDITGYDTKTLCEKLSQLESQNEVKLVGFHENVIVLTAHIEPWTVVINDTRCIPLPWITFDGTRYDIFFKWASTIMNKVFENPGFSITYLTLVCDHLTPRSVQEICLFLEKYKSVTLKVIAYEEAGLFSDEDTIPELIDFYKYASMKNILVFPTKDALTRFSYVKKVILDMYEKKCTRQ